MKKLKRALALAVTAILLVGVTAVGAGAAYSDAAGITHTAAVDELTELGVMQGLPDGSFGPGLNVDRASMAQIITLVLNGGEDPKLGVKAVASYSDVKDNWAERYIEYCNSIGTIAGRGNGTFDPDGAVTGSEAAKMLLVALGYDAKVFGLVGDSWEVNVNVRANDIGLYEGLKGLIASEPISRDATAQMTHNALKAFAMGKEPLLMADGTVTFSYKLSTETLQEKCFKK